MRGIFLLKLRDKTLWVHMWGLLLWNGSHPCFEFVSWRFYYEPALKQGLSTHYSIRTSTKTRGEQQ